MPNTSCPLCSSRAVHPFHQDKKRDYWRCSQCALVFVPEHQHLPAAIEKSIYDLHQNHAGDDGYRQFLSRLATPMLVRLPPQALGLDYGCGPGPVLSGMLAARGHHVNLYDLYYAPDQNCLRHSYDFIVCTEVVEHFRQPQTEFERLFSLLKPRGVLGLMTKLVTNAEAFSRWHYKNDQTHISYFSLPTMQWLADRYHCQLEILGQDVIIFNLQP
jgi:hypothetical protein